MNRFQRLVYNWTIQCFGHRDANNLDLRTARFLEEALELAQASNLTKTQAKEILEYVYGRPVGEPAQEVGGVMVTLASYCSVRGIELESAAYNEMCRCWQQFEKIAEKHRNKPTFGVLPE